MISKTKYVIDDATIVKLFEAAGIKGVTDIAPLGAGEYNAVFSMRSGDKEYALKIAPSDDIEILTYEKDMMASEVFWYKQIREKTSIRVPEIYFTDFSKTIIPVNYFIMEKLAGVQMDKLEMTDAEKEESLRIMARMIGEIHNVNGEKFGYIQNGLHDNWYLAFKAMAESLLNDCVKKGRKTKRGIKFYSYIDAYKDLLISVESTMVNFDMWMPNIICQRENDTIKYAWIDPERSMWGDRIMDFVCLEIMKDYPEKKISIEAYNKVVKKPILINSEEEIRYSLSLGYLALIMETEKYYRYTWKNFGWWRNVIASAMFYNRAFKVLDGKKR